jgi:drug/metabolite transporter (DMT)-like permease
MGVVFALLAAVAYGAASVFQAIAAKRAPSSPIKAFMQPTFVLGLLLDGAGFVFQFLALRTVPLFLVQAALAASLAVTAVLSIPLLKLRLGPVQWSAVAAVCVGLAMLGVSAGRESVERPPTAFRIGLVVAVFVLALAGWAATRLSDPTRPVLLGLVAGLCFSVVALAARAISQVPLTRIFTEIEFYALIAAGVLAFLFYTIGLQKASVTSVTAALVIGETVLPAVIGVMVFGDGTRPGFLPVAVIGFIVAVAGSLMLARFGSVEEPASAASPAAEPARG